MIGMGDGPATPDPFEGLLDGRVARSLSLLLRFSRCFFSTFSMTDSWRTLGIGVRCFGSPVSPKVKERVPQEGLLENDMVIALSYGLDYGLSYGA